MSAVKIPKEKTAIVLIEPQNDFLTEGGTMYAHIKEQLAERNVIANLKDLLMQARGRVAKIFYCPFHPFDPGFPELKKGGPARWIIICAPMKLSMWYLLDFTPTGALSPQPVRPTTRATG